MDRRLVLLGAFIIVFIGILGRAVTVQRVSAGGTIYIRIDGGVDPLIAPISRVDNITYTFTDNVYDSVVVERSNIIIDGNGYTLQGSGSGRGLNLYNISNVVIKNTNIKGFFHGIFLNSASSNIVSGNNITNNSFDGIWLEQSFGNTISQNYITSNEWHGIRLYWSSNNTLFGNNVTNNQYGIRLYLSSNNTLYGNVIKGNKYNFDVWGHELSHFMHSIDTSNFVNGKPVHYLANQKDLVIYPATHLQVGYLALINCVNATIEGLNLTSNAQGLLLAYSSNSRIIDNNIANNDFGVWFEHSFNNSLSRNYITNNDYGVWLGSSFDNTVSGNNMTNNQYGIWPYLSYNNTLSENNVTNNRYGIWFDSSFKNIFSGNSVTNNTFGAWFCGSFDNTLSGNIMTNNLYGIQLGYDPSFNNTFHGNNITNNEVGVQFFSSSRNKFYHNNFINNKYQVQSYDSLNIWDNGYPSGGNYWSDYNGTDASYDGIGDSSCPISHLPTTPPELMQYDYYPLMGMFSSFNASLGEYVNIISNSTVESFEYFEFNSTIRVRVSNMTPSQASGFCSICIPHTLISEPYNVTINGASPSYWNYMLYDNVTHRWIYFAYEHSTLEIIIISEFPSSIIPPLLMFAILLAVIVYRKKTV